MKKSRHYKQAKVWFDELPALLEQWWNAMNPGGGADSHNHHHPTISLSPQVIANIATEMDFTNRALAIAALLNPSSPPFVSPHQKHQHSSTIDVKNNRKNANPAVSLDIRPALLACRNYYDRVHLVHAALQASIRQQFTGGDDTE